MINGHDIPALDYFTNKNAFSGSEGNDFRFRLENKDDKIHAYIWNEDLCYELCTVTAQEEFELSKDGLAEAVDWVFSQKNKK